MNILNKNNQYINGDKMKEKLNVLDELNKGSCMGVDAIDFILDKSNELISIFFN